jgi:hypothetical protein
VINAAEEAYAYRRVWTDCADFRDEKTAGLEKRSIAREQEKRERQRIEEEERRKRHTAEKRERLIIQSNVPGKYAGLKLTDWQTETKAKQLVWAQLMRFYDGPPSSNDASEPWLQYLHGPAQVLLVSLRCV